MSPKQPACVTVLGISCIPRRTRHIDVAFGPFVFDSTDMRLIRDHAEIRLRPQTRRVLRVLLLHRGHTAGYEQVMAEAWEGTFVSRHIRGRDRC